MKHVQVERTSAKDIVAIILAVSFGLAMNLFVVAILYAGVFQEGGRLSENATQILTGWGGGVIGVLGAYVGYRAGKAEADKEGEDDLRDD